MTPIFNLPMIAKQILTQKLVAIIFCVAGALLMPSILKAQTISMDQVPVEDALRRLQLMGKIEADISFSSRPLQATTIGSWDSALRYLDPMYFKKGLHKIDKHFLGKYGYVAVLPFQLTQQLVTAQPFSELDGPMITSSGSQTSVSGGLFLSLGPLTIQYQPVFVWADNKNYRGTVQAPNYNYPNNYTYDHYDNKLIFNGILDNKFLQKQLFGNSSIRLNAGALSVGISSENITWGPSLMNPLIMSNHAPGFIHVAVNSRRPLRTRIGSFEWQWVAGYLEEINPAYRGISENYLGYGKGQTQDEKRYFNGATISYQPKWFKGLSMGVSRVVQEPELVLKDFPDWNLIFRNVSRSNDAAQYSDYLLLAIEENRDQYAGAFLRWVWQEANAEFYTEWGRNDAFYNMRDFIQVPEHSRAYTYGFRKLIGYDAQQKNKAAKYWQIASEYTRIQQPASWPSRSAGTWYVHGGYRPSGYGQLGQNLGAPIGSGATYGMVRLSQFEGMQQMGIQLESTSQNGETFEESGLAFTNPSITKWVDMGARLFFDYPYKNFMITSTIAFKRSFNYKWSQPTGASGVGISNPNDLDSFLFKIGIRYL